MDVFIQEIENGKGTMSYRNGNIAMFGEIYDLNSGKLIGDFLTEVFRATEGIDAVCFDMKDLIYINSSGIKSIVQWLMEMKNQRSSVKIKFIYNSNISWQASCLQPLKIISPNTVSVEPFRKSSM